MKKFKYYMIKFSVIAIAHSLFSCGLCYLYIHTLGTEATWVTPIIAGVPIISFLLLIDHLFTLCRKVPN
jgi:hypothetical protein